MWGPDGKTNRKKVPEGRVKNAVWSLSRGVGEQRIEKKPEPKKNLLCYHVCESKKPLEKAAEGKHKELLPGGGRDKQSQTQAHVRG